MLCHTADSLSAALAYSAGGKKFFEFAVGKAADDVLERFDAADIDNQVLDCKVGVE